MADVAEETSLRLEGVVDAVEHVVHRRGEAGDIVAALDRDAFGHRLPRHPLGGVAHLADGAEEARGHERGGPGDDGDGDGRRDHPDLCRLVELGELGVQVIGEDECSVVSVADGDRRREVPPHDAVLGVGADDGVSARRRILHVQDEPRLREQIDVECHPRNEPRRAVEQSDGAGVVIRRGPLHDGGERLGRRRPGTRAGVALLDEEPRRVEAALKEGVDLLQGARALLQEHREPDGDHPEGGDDRDDGDEARAHGERR